MFEKSFNRSLPVSVLFLACVSLQGEEPRLHDTTPWNLQALSKVPEFKWGASRGPVRDLLYVGETFNGRPTQVFAYYATPGNHQASSATERNLPAVVLIHGGGGTAFREWAELWAKRGYAAIAMDLGGDRPIPGTSAHRAENRQRLKHGGPAQTDAEKFGSVDKPAGEQWPYHAVANVIRAHSLIGSFPEVDAERTAVTGISWGGYLTCIVAGIDNRFKAAVPVYGCGYLHENSAWLGRFDDMTAAQRDRWVTLWDPSRYVQAISMPILFVNGTNDFAYPLDSYMKTFAAVPTRRQLRVTANMPHGHQAGWAPKEIGLFIDQHVRGGVPLPKIGEPRIQEGKVLCDWQGPVELISAELNYTVGTEEINKRTWVTAQASIRGNHVIAAPPPKDATAWFLTIKDKRDAVISSTVALK